MGERIDVTSEMVEGLRIVQTEQNSIIQHDTSISKLNVFLHLLIAS